jgi:hypothetical protein
MATQIRFRYDTAANWSSVNPLLARGEIGIDLQSGILKVGNGVGRWNALPSTPIAVKFLNFELLASGDPSSGTNIAVGVGPGVVEGITLDIDPGPVVLAADSASFYGVSPVVYESSLLTNFNGVGAEEGDLFRFDGSSWVASSFAKFVAAIPQKIVQNIALRHSVYFSRGNLLTGVFRWALPTDTVAAGVSAPAALNEHAGFANPGVAGYFSRGINLQIIYKWGFPAETVSTTTNAGATVSKHAGFADPGVAGYFSRGNLFTPIYKWSFPADVSTQLVNQAPATLNQHAGFANPRVAGYFSRGTESNVIYKLGFPTETFSTLTTTRTGLRRHGGFSNNAVAGYFSTGGTDLVVVYSFPSDTESAFNSTISMLDSAGSANSSVAGYFFNGGSRQDLIKVSFPTNSISFTGVSPQSLSPGNASFANA